MPCQSEYLNATFREKESVRVAGYLCYLRDIFGVQIDEGAEDASKSYYGKPEKLDEYTARLCQLCNDIGTALDKRGDAIGLELRLWWLKHQAADEQRRADNESKVQKQEREDRQELQRLKEKYES